jgi:hypothetical protein
MSLGKLAARTSFSPHGILFDIGGVMHVVKHTACPALGNRRTVS